jgi:hypothetical protein
MALAPAVRIILKCPAKKYEKKEKLPAWFRENSSFDRVFPY